MIQAATHYPRAESPWNEGRKVGRYPAGRVCSEDGCTHVLSTYNAGPLCEPCQTKKEAEAQEKYRAAHPAPLHPRVESPVVQSRLSRRQEVRVLEVCGVKLIPAKVPGRLSTSNERWPAVVAEFLRSGEPSVRVEAPPMKPNGIYTALHNLLKGSHECQPSVRGAHCYLVRIHK
jgi:hypothetical protein